MTTTLKKLYKPSSKAKLAKKCEQAPWTAKYKSCVVKAKNFDDMAPCIEIEVRDDFKRKAAAAKNPPKVPDLKLSRVSPKNGSGTTQGYSISLPPNVTNKFCASGGCVHKVKLTDKHSYIISVGKDDKVTDLPTAGHRAARKVLPPRVVTKREKHGEGFLIHFGKDRIWTKVVYFAKDKTGYRYAACRGPLGDGHAAKLLEMCTSLKVD